MMLVKELKERLEKLDPLLPVRLRFWKNQATEPDEDWVAVYVEPELTVSPRGELVLAEDRILNLAEEKGWRD